MCGSDLSHASSRHELISSELSTIHMNFVSRAIPMIMAFMVSSCLRGSDLAKTRLPSAIVARHRILRLVVVGHMRVLQRLGLSIPFMNSIWALP